MTLCTEGKGVGFQGRGERATRPKLEWTWHWSALATPPPCGVVVPRGSGGGRRGRKEGPKALGFPQENAGSPAPLLPQPRPHPLGHAAFWLLPRSLQLLSPALELSWCLQLLETEGVIFRRGVREWGGREGTAELLCSGPRKIRIFSARQHTPVA